jgi:hypothetical protein
MAWACHRLLLSWSGSLFLRMMHRLDEESANPRRVLLKSLHLVPPMNQFAGWKPRCQM